MKRLFLHALAALLPAVVLAGKALRATRPAAAATAAKRGSTAQHGHPGRTAAFLRNSPRLSSRAEHRRFVPARSRGICF